MRDDSRDGWQNKLETYVLTNFEPAWSLLERVAPVRRLTNRALINHAILKFPTRPNPLSTMAPYTSWASLTDRTLRRPPPAAGGAGRAAAGRGRSRTCSARRARRVPCAKSTVLFAYFAQWFTDGFLRSDRHRPQRDPRAQRRPTTRST